MHIQFDEGVIYFLSRKSVILSSVLLPCNLRTLAVIGVGTGTGAGVTGGSTVDTPAESVGDKIKKYLPGRQAISGARALH